MPNIYKLAYPSQEALIQNLLSKGVLTEVEGQQVYAQGTHAVVLLGHIALQKAVFDSQGNEVSPAVLSDKYHADIMTDNDYNFGDNEVQVKEGEPQAHAFA